MDATRALAVQHRTIEALFDDVAHETRRRGRASAVSRLTEELVAHLTAEENVFYPAVRRAFDEEDETSDRVRDEHLALRIELRRVLETSVGAASFAERIGTLRGCFAKHVRDEEAELFPRVVRAVSEAAREILGAEILASRPPIWIVTTEGGAHAPAGEDWGARRRVCLPALTR
jgi:hemerythrin superfamily protein